MLAFIVFAAFKIVVTKDNLSITKVTTISDPCGCTAVTTTLFCLLFASSVVVFLTLNPVNLCREGVLPLYYCHQDVFLQY